MIEAWLSSSEMIASCSSATVWKSPSFAFQHDPYRIVSSVPKNWAMRASSSWWMVCVPQMKRTDARP